MGGLFGVKLGTKENIEADQNFKKIKKNRDEKKEKEDTKCIDNMVNEKEKDKKQLYELFINIDQNMEQDETKGLDIDYLVVFIVSIFPDNIPNIFIDFNRYLNEEIKNFKNGTNNQINLFKFDNFDKKQSFCFICVIKRVDKKTCDIIYKFKIINERIEKIKKVMNENEECKQLLTDFKEKELKQLNEKI